MFHDDGKCSIHVLSNIVAIPHVAFLYLKMCDQGAEFFISLVLITLNLNFRGHLCLEAAILDSTL